MSIAYCVALGATLGYGQCMTEQIASQRLLRPEEVQRLAGVSAATLYRYVRAGRFPAPGKLSKRCNRWRERDVTAWLASRETAAA